MIPPNTPKMRWDRLPGLSLSPKGASVEELTNALKGAGYLPVSISTSQSYALITQDVGDGIRHSSILVTW